MTDKRVPREPTQAMIDAAIGIDLLETGWNRGMAILWQQMYDAAPAAPDERVPPCPFCSGSGKRYTPTRNEHGDGYLEEPCIPCGGTGKRVPAAKGERDGTELVHSSYVSDTTRDILALRRERDALKAALRSLAICVWFVPADGPDDEQKGKRCIICNQKWGMRDREQHAPGCLAAPEDAP